MEVIQVAPSKRDDYNRKSFHSVILQVVCDPRGYFMSIDVGFPGRMADSKDLRYLPPSTQAQCAILETLAITYTAMLRIHSSHGF